MGTYTTNYNLFMPTVGEQGWGELVNENFETIDATMESLSNSISTLETDTDAIKEKLDAIEVNNGVVEGDFTGIFTGKLYVNAVTSFTQNNGDVLYATCEEQSVSTQNRDGTTITSETLTVGGYLKKISMSYPYQFYPGVVIPDSSNFTDSVPSSINRTLTFTFTPNMNNPVNAGYWVQGDLYVNGENVYSTGHVATGAMSSGQILGSTTLVVKDGDTAYAVFSGHTAAFGRYFTATVTISELPNYYINVV